MHAMQTLLITFAEKAPRWLQKAEVQVPLKEPSPATFAANTEPLEAGSLDMVGTE